MSKIVIGTYLEHLDELRRRLWVAVLALLAASAVSLIYSDKLLELVLRPAQAEIPALYFFTPADAFVVKIKLALLSGFLVSSPVLFGQFWLFVSPAMHAHEKKAVAPFVLFTSVLFFSGAAFAFFKVLPATLHFLIGMQTEWLKPLLSVSEYLSFVSLMTISFGVAFNLPAFVLILVSTGVVNVQMLNQFQRQVIVLIFIAAAILTPGPDIASQLMLAVPLLILYEASVLLAVIAQMLKRKNRESDRLMAWLLAIPFGVLAVYSVFAAFKYTRMIGNIFLQLVYKPSSDPLSGQGERITILDSSDREIPALFLERKGSDRVLIFCHESGSAKESWEKYAYFFPEMGFHVLSADFKEKDAEAEQNSLLQWAREDEVEKLLTVIRWAKHAISTRARVVLFGVSKGADLALAASFRDASVEAVVTDGLFSMKEIFRDYIRRWAPILVRPNLFGENYPDWVVNIFTNLGFWSCQRRTRERFVDVEKLLRQKHVPLLMIHGELDDYVPVSHQKFLEKLEGSKSRGRFVVRDAAHNEAVVRCREDYEKEVKTFLDKVLR